MAAESEFRRFGYRRTTVDEITRAARTGKGSFYLHFDSKEAAYLAVVEGSLGRFLQRAEAALQRDGQIPERMRALVEETLAYYGQDELLRSSLFGGGGLVEGQVARRAAEIQRVRLRQVLAEAVAAGQGEGTIRPGLDPARTGSLLFEIGWAIVLRELDGTSDVPFDEALTSLSDLTGLGLLTR